MDKSNWVWMPHAGHFICGYRCNFRLNTYVNGFIISTVGEMLRTDLNDLSKFEEIGLDRLYETMVFKAEQSENSCCPYEAIVSLEGELDFKGYNDPVEAYKGHLEMCEEWDKELIDIPFKDDTEGKTYSGGLDAIGCKCGTLNYCKDPVILNCIAAVDYHLKTCNDKENCNDHGQSMPFLCGNCKAYLCSVLILNEEYLK